MGLDPDKLEDPEFQVLYDCYKNLKDQNFGISSQDILRQIRLDKLVEEIRANTRSTTEIELSVQDVSRLAEVTLVMSEMMLLQIVSTYSTPANGAVFKDHIFHPIQDEVVHPDKLGVPEVLSEYDDVVFWRPDYKQIIQFIVQHLAELDPQALSEIGELENAESFMWKYYGHLGLVFSTMHDAEAKVFEVCGSGSDLLSTKEILLRPDILDFHGRSAMLAIGNQEIARFDLHNATADQKREYHRLALDALDTRVLNCANHERVSLTGCYIHQPDLLERRMEREQKYGAYEYEKALVIALVNDYIDRSLDGKFDSNQGREVVDKVIDQLHLKIKTSRIALQTIKSENNKNFARSSYEKLIEDLSRRLALLNRHKAFLYRYFTS